MVIDGYSREAEQHTLGGTEEIPRGQYPPFIPKPEHVKLALNRKVPKIELMVLEKRFKF